MSLKLPLEEPEAAPWRVIALGDLVRALWEPRQDPDDAPRIVAVDGRSGSGKTTVADGIHRFVRSSAVIHTDDIAWHHSFFDWSDLLIEGLLKPLSGGRSVRYRPPGWVKKGRPGAIAVDAGLDLVIVEGVGAGRTEIRPWIDSTIWVQSDLDQAERRGIARDGGTEEAARFWHEWMAEESRFLKQQRPWERATLIVNGTPDVAYDRNTEIVVSAARDGL